MLEPHDMIKGMEKKYPHLGRSFRGYTTLPINIASVVLFMDDTFVQVLKNRTGEVMHEASYRSNVTLPEQ
jgi:hypothetical protein